LISNFRRVLNVICFLLGNSLASEFYTPTFFFYLRLLVTTRVSPTRYTTGYLQRLYKLIPFTNLPQVLVSHLDGTFLECFRVLVSCGIFLKCVENASEESCNAVGVYVILQNQRWGKRFEY